MRMVKDPRWRTSSFSPGDTCVEVAEVGDHIAVRNSNRPGAATLLVGRAAAARWLGGVRLGELDDLVV